VGSFSFPLPNFYFPISNFYLQGRAKLACDEGLQGAQSRIEFRGREAPVAVESAQKVLGRLVTLARVAFDTAGNQVAVGMAVRSGRVGRRGRGTVHGRGCGGGSKSRRRVRDRE